MLLELTDICDMFAINIWASVSEKPTLIFETLVAISTNFLIVGSSSRPWPLASLANISAFLATNEAILPSVTRGSSLARGWNDDGTWGGDALGRPAASGGTPDGPVGDPKGVPGTGDGVLPPGLTGIGCRPTAGITPVGRGT